MNNFEVLKINRDDLDGDHFFEFLYDIKQRAISVKDIVDKNQKQLSIIDDSIDATIEHFNRLLFEDIYLDSVPDIDSNGLISNMNINSFIDEQLELLSKDESVIDNKNPFLESKYSLTEYIRLNKKDLHPSFVQYIEEMDKKALKHCRLSKRELEKKSITKLKEVLPLSVDSDTVSTMDEVKKANGIDDITMIINNNVKSAIKDTIDRSKVEKLAYSAIINEIKNDTSLVTPTEVEEAIDRKLTYRNSNLHINPFLEEILSYYVEDNDNDFSPIQMCANDYAKWSLCRTIGFLSNNKHNTEYFNNLYTR